jgi:hypothetical protein
MSKEKVFIILKDLIFNNRNAYPIISKIKYKPLIDNIERAV